VFQLHAITDSVLFRTTGLPNWRKRYARVGTQPEDSAVRISKL